MRKPRLTLSVEVDTAKGSISLSYLDKAGRRHRTDGGPAFLTRKRSVAREMNWFNRDRLHRDTGPAAVLTSGINALTLFCWRQADTRHRHDGPSDTWADGDMLWFVDGDRLAILLASRAPVD